VRRGIGLALILLSISATALLSAPGEEDARRAARAFGQALTTGKAEGLRPILAEHGRLQLSLARLGPEDGSFGAGQVEALFRDFLADGKVRSFEILRLECDGQSTALAHGRASITDRQGRNARVGIHLAFKVENDRWVLREIKETAE
jgi:hypothetical protein